MTEKNEPSIEQLKKELTHRDQVIGNLSSLVGKYQTELVSVSILKEELMQRVMELEEQGQKADNKHKK